MPKKGDDWWEKVTLKHACQMRDAQRRWDERVGGVEPSEVQRALHELARKTAEAKRPESADPCRPMSAGVPPSVFHSMFRL